MSNGSEHLPEHGTLDQAVAAAKVAAGLDASLKYPAYRYHEYIAPEWVEAFWELMVEIAFRELVEGLDNELGQVDA
jgi:hypothetical protein